MKQIAKCVQYCLCLVKLLVAFIYVQFHKTTLYSQNIWLIQEKHTEARDNGYHLYKYIKSEHPEVNVFYSITKNSIDRKKVALLGESIIDADTIKHYIYYLSARYSIGSQKFGACPYPTDWVNRFKVFRRNDQKVVFLQHGITINAGKGLEYEKTQFDLFVCAAIPEHTYITETLGYPEDKAKLLGFCRYDNLICHNTRKIILIMPTFRQWLVATNREKYADEFECQAFEKSLFYQSYYNLITDKQLLDIAQLNGYTIIFYLHYSLQSYIQTFAKCQNDTVLIADRNNYDVQQLMIDSDIMVTDYSSVFCDFAYMKKPEVFYQFDEDEFRTHHYKEGYFSYRDNGFGPVYKNNDQIVEYLIRMISNGCHMEQKYIDRVNDFFRYFDYNNCERNYKAIKEILNNE